jgi:cyanate permease
MGAFEPLIVLVLLPVLLGIGAATLARETRKAALVAMLACALAVVAGVVFRVPEESWNWLAAMLVLPVPIALALAMVLVWHGRDARRHRARQ